MQKTKVRIPINEGSISGETLWAEKVGENLFRLCNIPLIANGYAEGDIVLCQPKNGFDQVISIKEDSGNGTIRLIFTSPHGKEAQHILKELESVGCTYEFSSSKLVGVTIPRNLEIPFSQLSNFLNASDDKTLSGWEVAKEIIRAN